MRLLHPGEMGLGWFTLSGWGRAAPRAEVGVWADRGGWRCPACAEGRVHGVVTQPARGRATHSHPSQSRAPQGAQKGGARILHCASPPFPLSPCHPWCDPPRFALGAGRGGGACRLHRLCPSSRRTPVCRGTAEPRPLRDLLFTHRREGGVSTTPCAVPRARPLHPTFRMPHCAHRPACGTTSVWHPKGGAQGSCTRNARGVVLTRHAEGAPPGLHAVLHGPIARARAHSGVNPVTRPHANGGRVPAAPAACPPPSLHPRSLLERTPPSPHPICAGREGAQGGGPPPSRVLRSLG